MAPWGVLEARAVGLEAVIRGARAVDARYSVPYDELLTPSAAEAAKGDASTILPGVRGPLCASHPGACQALAGEAARLGAELVRGVGELRVQAGARPSVTYLNGREMQVRPRLVIGADGRASTVRKQSGIHIDKAPASHVIAGLLVEGASRWPDDQFSIGVEGDLQFYVFPQGGGRVRLYTCHANDQAARWAGRAGPQRFLRAFARLQAIPAALGLGDGTAAGPCATFGGEQTWCEEPYADGVVLLGDAGGYDDPVDGQGLSLALRDVRQLSELLLATSDWTVAALRSYGQQRAERLRRMRRVSLTFAALMTTFTADGRARRNRFRAASGTVGDDIRLALGAIHLGPDRLPVDAFSDQLHESLLA
jgi:2-polyprenyl-6-methoxyphenol hydroxylase-like FAD-dependent oxidoreductase